MRMLPIILALCVLPLAAAGAPSPAAAVQDTVKNPEESGGARIRPADPKVGSTSGSDIDSRGLGLDGRSHDCVAMMLRRQDGGITKVRKCND